MFLIELEMLLMEIELGNENEQFIRIASGDRKKDLNLQEFLFDNEEIFRDDYMGGCNYSYIMLILCEGHL